MKYDFCVQEQDTEPDMSSKSSWVNTQVQEMQYKKESY